MLHHTLYQYTILVSQITNTELIWIDNHNYKYIKSHYIINQLLQSDPFEAIKWPCLGLSDLELMVEKTTLKNQVHTCILEKTQINAHLGDFCFLSGFSPDERNCTTFGIFALHGCWSQSYERILPGNKGKYPGKSVNTRLSKHTCTFFVQMSTKSQSERKSKQKLLWAEKNANWRFRYVYHCLFIYGFIYSFMYTVYNSKGIAIDNGFLEIDSCIL